MNEGPLENALYLCEKVEDVKQTLEGQFPIFSTLSYWQRGGPASDQRVPIGDRGRLRDLYHALVDHVIGENPEAGVIAHRGVRVINRFVKIEDAEPLWEAYLDQLKHAAGGNLSFRYPLFSYKGPRREVICLDGQTIPRPRFTAILAEEHKSGLTELQGKMEDIQEIMQVLPEGIAYQNGAPKGIVPILQRLEELNDARLLLSSPEDFLNALRNRPHFPKGQRGHGR